MPPPDESEPLPLGGDKFALVRRMFDEIAPRYDLLNRLMSLGLDRGWRRRTVAMLDLSPSSLVLDVACGTAHLAEEIVAIGAQSVGVDLSLSMLRAARVTGIALVEADSVHLPFRAGEFDGIVCGFAVRNFADLPAMLAESARVLRPSGRLALLEVDVPEHALLRTGHDIWFNHVVPRLGALLSSREAYRYLPRSVAYLPDHRSMAALVEEAGFTGVTRHPLSGGLVQVVTATRLGTPTDA